MEIIKCKTTALRKPNQALESWCFPTFKGLAAKLNSAPYPLPHFYGTVSTIKDYVSALVLNPVVFTSRLVARSHPGAAQGSILGELFRQSSAGLTCAMLTLCRRPAPSLSEVKTEQVGAGQGCQVTSPLTVRVFTRCPGN